jgi:hypothetical protein
MTKDEHKRLRELRDYVERNYRTKQDFDNALDEGLDRASGRPMSLGKFFGLLFLGALIMMAIAKACEMP